MKQNQYLQATLKIHTTLKASKLAPKTIGKIRNELLLVKKLFSTSQLNAILLSSILQESLLDGDVELRQLMNYYEADREFAPKLSLAVEEMLEKGFVHRNLGDRRGGKRVSLTSVAMNTVMKGDSKKIKPLVIKTLGDFIYEVSRVQEMRKERNITIERYIQEINKLVVRGNHLAFVNFIQRFKLPEKELVILLQMAVNAFNDREGDDLVQLVRDVAEDPREHYDLCAKFRRQEAKLFSEGLIEFSLAELGIDTEINLTQLVNEQLFAQQPHSLNLLFKPTLCHVHSPESIRNTILVYDDDMLNEMNVIRNALHPNRFKAAMKKLNQSNLKGGLTILLHGLPGTGKTESVMQLAKASNRTVLRLEISRIKNMWVGESEKNLKKVFTEYKRCRQSMPNEPILLFNEADAILSRRRNVNSSVDQMENSLQNILLQELEEFDGILFATTNFKQNLDAAFERRFLYKVDFSMPSAVARLEMLKFNFPELKENDLTTIVNKVEFTGSAIDNVKRKWVLSHLFDGHKKLTAGLLHDWLVEESRGTRKNEIGFKVRV